ncbi:hypothetical protein BD779DRAFT_1679046 [Infundibulicybe gibba]|nr:hypothetical protein BD779DRAFT_1679046 [Infundibulicybe gibba]
MGIPSIVRAVTPFCPDLELVDTHAEPAKPFDGKDITPSVIAYARSFRRTQTSDIVFAEIIPEFNYADTDDPFTDRPKLSWSSDDPESFERDSRATRDTLGQITLYAAAHLAAQFRTHIFSLLVFREHSRLLRWDRSGWSSLKNFRYGRVIRPVLLALQPRASRSPWIR